MTEFIPSFNFDLQAVFKTNDINQRTQTHLTKVYAAMGSGLVTSFLAGCLAEQGLLPGWLLVALTVASVIGEIAIAFTRQSKFANTYLKPGTFYGFATILGGIIGLLFLSTPKLAGVVTTSFIYSIAIFTTFSLFALATTILFGSFACVLILSIINIFVFSLLLEAAIGILVGALYVIIDTQIIIHKTENGVFDVYTDAKELLVDFAKIFFEIMRVLSEDKKKKEERRRS